MTHNDRAAFDTRLHRVAIGFVLPAGLDVHGAVILAEDLLTSGDSGPATLTVASLARDAVGSEADGPVREMLAEHGIQVPSPTDEEAEYQVLLRAFGYWNLTLYYLEGPFYTRSHRGTTRGHWTEPSSSCWTNAAI